MRISVFIQNNTYSLAWDGYEPLILKRYLWTCHAYEYLETNICFMQRTMEIR